ncbi:hypothetical protein [Roseivivax marinus]|uniref:hypothetical protein n=1 Tax=Roseivivax marinus TaxID=1379903 RepID=UPI00273EB8B8|nr:hypothetical protein [Roseivivax marinus]
MTKTDDIAGAEPVLRHGWYWAEADGALVHARHWPPRFDVSAEGTFPRVSSRKLAVAIRQDLWRKMKRLRGFSPVVTITHNDEFFSVRIGGRVGKAPVSESVQTMLEDLLTSPTHRAAWRKWAGRGGAA